MSNTFNNFVTMPGGGIIQLTDSRAYEPSDKAKLSAEAMMKVIKANANKLITDTPEVTEASD